MAIVPGIPVLLDELATVDCVLTLVELVEFVVDRMVESVAFSTVVVFLNNVVESAVEELLLFKTIGIPIATDAE